MKLWWCGVLRVLCFFLSSGRRSDVSGRVLGPFPVLSLQKRMFAATQGVAFTGSPRYPTLHSLLLARAP